MRISVIIFLLVTLCGCTIPKSPPRTGSNAASVKVQNSVDISMHGKRLLGYQARPTPSLRPGIDPSYRRGGYIHPLRTPAGVVITDDYPTNHLHHHGVWFAWTNTRFENRRPDFWNMGSKKGTVEFVRFKSIQTRQNEPGFQTEHHHIDLLAPGPKTAVTETWNVVVPEISHEDFSKYWIFDLTSTQECATALPLMLPKYHYGGLGFRGHEQWNGTNALRVLTSEGESNRVKANETRARWCRLSGEVDGKTAGIAILCHPGNFRAPQPIRVHPTEPFFCYAPSQIGDWSIKPGEKYVSQYRFVVFDDELDGKTIEQLWNDYAAR